MRANDLIQLQSRYPSMELDRRLEQCSTFNVEYVDEEGRIIETADKVQPLPRQKLHECLDAKLRQWGLSPEYVAFFVENSRTPLPDNCDAGYLAGHRIVVRA
ncbi:hypothetical protein Tcan_12441 [Toxocara canis]|uniref:RBD domain-containing protein n=1 Tax=Toxocara canis TaxID=6265 RepID=A0A0B2V9F9_TOXCA|nr:hypothetical protein Tcan_12441 [Toxocara canis]